MSAPAPPTAADVRNAWDRIADRFDQHTTPRTLAFGDEVIATLPVGAGTRVLDIGAGSGGLAIPAARRGADVVAVDIAPAMIERLTDRARSEGLRIDARVGDGSALDLADDSFDVTVSLNGVSLIPDLGTALRETVRVTRPGGEVAIATFGPLPHVEFVGFFLGAIRTVAPAIVPPPTAPPLPPFRLADPAVFESALAGAGLRDVSVMTRDWEMTVTSVDEFLDVVTASNPIAGQLSAGLDDEQAAEVRQVLAGMLRERAGAGPDAVLHAEMRIGRGTA